jgi:diguanylate cyclase (GGDEF)-like protein/PAS domain S-box-containing protein
MRRGLATHGRADVAHGGVTRSAGGPFRDLTRMAAHAASAPIAFLQLHEGTQAHLESHFGIDLPAERTPIVAGDDGTSLFVISDARDDPRFADHPLVTAQPWARSLVGAPVEDDCGTPVGVLYVVDTVVRCFTREQLSMLTDVARQLSLQLQHDQQLTALYKELAAKESAEALSADLRRLMEGVLNHADVAIYANDLDGRVLLANPATHVMLGCEDGRLVGERLRDQLPTELADDLAHHDDEVAGRGRRRLFAERAPHVDGTEHSYLATRFPLVDEQGKVYAVAGVSTDVTDLFETRTALADTEERWRSLVDCAPIAVVVVDAGDGRIRYANCQAAGLFGMALSSDVTGRRFADFTPRGAGKAYQSLFTNTATTPVRNAPMRLAPVDGGIRDITVNAVAITFNDRPSFQLALQDVTAERAAHIKLVESESFQRAVLAASPDVIYVMNTPDWQPIWSSGNVLLALGYSELELAQLGSRITEEVVHPEDLERLREVNQASLALPDGRATQLRYRCRSKAGDYRWFTRRLTPFARDREGNVTQVLAIARDITGAIHAEDRLARAALHDPLTGLPNRVLLADRLANALSRAERSNTEVAVLFCDLDGFKHVNDLSGHTAGDGVLLATAARLSAELRPHDTVARVGGDEFVVILEPPLRSTPTALSSPADASDTRVDALGVADRIKRALAQPIEFGEHEHVVTASVGITFARPGEGAEETLRDADSAMSRAKALGKNRCEIFDKHLRVEAVERGRVEQLLRSALAAKLDPDRPPSDLYRQPTPQLWVAYQPIVNLKTRRVEGVEALARLTDGQRRPVSPEDFIPIAEETGLIGPLGRFVLEQACQDLASWQSVHTLGVSVNLSARQAGLDDLVEQVKSALSTAAVAPIQLTLELTETALLEAGQATMSALQALRDLGVHISIDDFGTGYASLRYLTELPVTGVKVDRSFTSGLPHDPTSNAIVQSVAGLARELSLSCVVEGIETVEQLEALPEGVHGQGYLLGRPTTAEETGRFLREHDQNRPGASSKKCPRQESNLRPST